MAARLAASAAAYWEGNSIACSCLDSSANRLRAAMTRGWLCPSAIAPNPPWKSRMRWPRWSNR
ncbi:hypothetical protein BAY61_14715 [Prauserella marina]|nr:hypothetical protein BAY61_14715 [Prauserella marina]